MASLIGTQQTIYAAFAKWKIAHYLEVLKRCGHLALTQPYLEDVLAEYVKSQYVGERFEFYLEKNKSLPERLVVLEKIRIVVNTAQLSDFINAYLHYSSLNVKLFILVIEKINKIQVPEVLSPAGTLDMPKAALLTSASKFIGGQAYGLRSRAGNFTL